MNHQAFALGIRIIIGSGPCCTHVQAAVRTAGGRDAAGGHTRDRARGAALSYAYNAAGMACLQDNPEVAAACLQRALFAAPAGDASVRTTLSNLGVCCMARGNAQGAMRYLRRAAALDEGAHRVFRARVRLNLCAVLNGEDLHSEALRYAREALALLGAVVGGGHLAGKDAYSPRGNGAAVDVQYALAFGL